MSTLAGNGPERKAQTPTLVRFTGRNAASDRTSARTRLFYVRLVVMRCKANCRLAPHV